ncbi:MAG: LacI family transcriptional regulator [Lachnospiraceae bacterium]|nr:LacI family transcriptional regulator [Lachnospiraceae bacterium]
MDSSKITIEDIARELNISKTTVSRAISGKGRVSSETRERVRSFIELHHYRPSAIAKSLAQSKTFNIAFTMPGKYGFIDMPFFQKCMWGISSIASESDYDVLLCMMEEGDISSLKRLIHNHKVDGVIIGRTYENDAAERFLLAEKVPFVTVGSSANPDAIQVDNDHYQACKELTSVLLLKGMKQLSLIGGSTKYIVNANRLNGFMDAHRTMGKQYLPELIKTEVDDPAELEAAVEQFVALGSDCIVCMDDFVCNQVLLKLNKMQVQIPKQIRIASFYNSAMLENNRPSITSLQFDAVEAGIRSCEILMRRMDGKKVSSKTWLGYNVKLNESTSVV